MLSAVMISFWDVEPMPAQAGTRLANVELVERSKQQKGYPRVRILIQNPAAAAPMSERQQQGVCQLL
jgi:hypothetical protein